MALRQAGEKIGRLLGGMIARADLFCGESNRVLREPAAGYFASNH